MKKKITKNIVTVEYKNIQYNYQLIKQHHICEQPIYAVVKANAYGHGLERTVAALYEVGCRHFATYHLPEAIIIKEQFPECAMMILGPIHESYYDIALSHNIEVAVTSMSGLSGILEYLSDKDHIHIKLETGMNRLGIREVEKLQFYDALKLIQKKNVAMSFYSHLSAGPFNDDRQRVLNQISKFDNWVQWLTENGIKMHTLHLNNSVNFPTDNNDYGARLGISLYGYPERFLKEKFPYVGKFKQALTVKSWIMDVKEVETNSYVGYGLNFKTKAHSIIAYIPMGYSDGYFRGLGNKSHVIITGKYAPVIGVVNMNLMAVDITHILGKDESISSYIGSEVVLLGVQDDVQVTAYELADLSETIPYEILTSLGNQTRRYYSDTE